MKYPLLLSILVSGCAPAFGASTATCPSVENGMWEPCNIIWPKTNMEFGIKGTSQTCRWPLYCLWRKVEYKIEWWTLLEFPGGRQEWHQGRSGIDWNIKCPCDDLFQIGLREDGIVIWRRKDQEVTVK